jgi:hypothetical protein
MPTGVSHQSDHDSPKQRRHNFSWQVKKKNSYTNGTGWMMGHSFYEQKKFPMSQTMYPTFNHRVNEFFKYPKNAKVEIATSIQRDVIVHRDSSYDVKDFKEREKEALKPIPKMIMNRIVPGVLLLSSCVRQDLRKRKMNKKKVTKSKR